MEITLYKLPFLDRNYTNVIDFKSITDRTNYFKSIPLKTYQTNGKNDHIREQLTVKATLKDLTSYDYLSYKDENNKDLYYFIYNKEYQTIENTILYLQLDVFTTFQFDVTFLPSYIDRCHVPRWNGTTPTNQTVDEGFNFDNYVLYSKDEIATLKNNYVMTSTDPLGVIGTSSGGGEGGAENGTGCFVVGSVGKLMIPCLGTVTATWHSYYNEVIDYWHDGIDIANTEGTPIYSSNSGYVKRVVNLGTEAWGLYVDIDHEDGTFTRYAHCSRVIVNQNDRIAQGQKIAEVGNTGTSTGAHLHWGVYSSNVAVDFDINDKLPKNKIISQNMGVL